MTVELDLITACINRERKAEYELYKLTYSYLMGISVRYVKSGEQAKEMVNIGFLRIITNLEKYRPEVPFKSWIRKIMVNVLIDEYRKEKRHSETIRYVEDYTETADFADINPALAKMEVEQIHTLITKLPAVSQKVFNLYVIDGFSHSEIAGMLGMSEGTSKWHLNFSRGKLKEMILEIVTPVKIIAQ